MKNIIIVLLLITTNYTISYSQLMRLDQIIDSAIRNNPILKMNESEYYIMKSMESGSQSWMPPTIGIGQIMTPYNAKLWKRDGNMNGMGNFALSFEQMIPNKSKLEVNKSISENATNEMLINKNLITNDLQYNIIKNYYSWILNKKKLKVLEENENLINYMIKSIELKYKYGTDKITSYYQAKAELSKIKNMKLMIENEIKNIRIMINNLMYSNPNNKFEITDSLEILTNIDLYNDNIYMIDNKQEIKILDNKIKHFKLKQDIDNLSLKPEYGVKFENMFGFGGQPMTYSIMLMIKLPNMKWSAKMYKANIESYQYQEEALNYQKSMLLNEFYSKYYSLSNNIELQKKQKYIYEQELIPDLQNLYNANLILFEQNTGDIEKLFSSWEKLNMNQMDYIEIQSKLIDYYLELRELIEKY